MPAHTHRLLPGLSPLLVCAVASIFSQASAFRPGSVTQLLASSGLIQITQNVGFVYVFFHWLNNRFDGHRRTNAENGQVG